MRFYVLAIQYNKEAGAENRTAPKAYNTRNEAVAEFHRQLAADMKNATLGWSLCMVINDAMGIEAQEKYVADETPITASEE